MSQLTGLTGVKSSFQCSLFNFRLFLGLFRRADNWYGSDQSSPCMGCGQSPSLSFIDFLELNQIVSSAYNFNWSLKRLQKSCAVSKLYEESELTSYVFRWRLQSKIDRLFSPLTAWRKLIFLATVLASWLRVVSDV